MARRGLLLLFFAIFSVLLQSSTSLISSSSVFINPSKVKQVSSRPRFPQRTLQVNLGNFWASNVNNSGKFGVCLLFRAFVYEGFLTELECDHMVSLVSFSSFHLRFWAWFGNLFLFSPFKILNFDLLKKAKASLKRSAVADNDSGESKFSEVRTSSGTFIAKGKVRFCHSMLP